MFNVVLLQLHTELLPASQHRFLLTLQLAILLKELRIGSVIRVSELLFQGTQLCINGFNPLLLCLQLALKRTAFLGSFLLPLVVLRPCG